MSGAEQIGPQPGPQTEFLSTSADIAFYGGAAGGGKTYGLLLESTRHVGNKNFGAVIFRRDTKQIREEGGLWDTSMEIYSHLGTPKGSFLRWEFHSGAKLTMAHLEYEKDILRWQGSQIPLIMFDEVTHFTKRQFFYMLSRNRSASGVKGYVRCTCNPDPDSWVREFIDWWIGPDGLAIPERSGKVRWFIQINNEFHWADSKEELFQMQKEKNMDPPSIPKSVTFIPAKIFDNQILMQKDPAYLANLHALPKVDRERLLDANWDVRPDAGMYFKKHYFPVIDVDDLPHDRDIIRFWDRAATEKTENNDPDWTVGLKMSKCRRSGIYFIEDVEREQLSPGKVQTLIENVTSQDGQYCTVGLSQDPGQAGKFELEHYVKLLAGYEIFSMTETGDKETRAKPSSSQAEHGNIYVVRGPWNNAFFNELEAFPTGRYKDQVDALSGAFSYFTSSKGIGKITALNDNDYTPMAPSLNSGSIW